MAEEEEGDVVENATKAAERLEAANAVTAELVAKQEKLMAQSILGGKSSAGETLPPVDENAGARAMLEGTGYDDMLFPVENK